MSEDYPEIELMEEVVEKHGEVHAITEEHDSWDGGDELEVRQGTATFDYDHETLIVEGSDTTHYVPMDVVVRYYPPTEVAH